MRSVLLLFIIVVTWVEDGEARANPAYLDQLLARADALDLAEQPAWRTLGHYRPDLLGQGWHSLIDSQSFFLAGNGKRDPSSELAATLRAFFAPAAGTGTDGGSPADRHPQCAFVARYRWLKSQLDFDSSRLPEQACDGFDSWLATIDASSATLIFPAAYLNNPASMFGHTLLRFDRPNQTEQTRLLSYAVNYGANTGTDNGVLFAVLGLTGGYPGTYSVEPYYDLVKRYSDIENRDIWEYQLDFSKAEVEQMLAHLWELQGQYSDYYFFDENCSYQLLFLMDAARPGLDLVADFPMHVIPVDSVRSVLRREGLLQRAVFRPSSETRIQHGLSTMTAAERDLVEQLASGAVTPEQAETSDLTPPQLADVLELAEAFVTYQLRTGTLERDVAAGRAWSLLAARSRIEAETERPPVPVPATRPDQGHGSARLALGIGARDGTVFQALRLRPAYHDTLDPSGGFAPGAGIAFLDTELRHYQGDNALVLDRLTVIGITSMTPRDELIQPVSWQLDLGLERLRVEKGDETGALVAAAGGGAGLSYLLGARIIWSTMLDAGVTGGEDCDETCGFNIGPAVSLLWPMTDRATFTAAGRYQGRFGKAIDVSYELRLGQSYGFTADLAVKLEVALEDDGGGLQPEVLTTLNWYF